MRSEFDSRISDAYEEHMRRTMDWIEDKIQNHRREPAHKGYHIEIAMEANWLQQLVAESVAKHRMILDLQRRLGDAAINIAWSRPLVMPSDVKLDAAMTAGNPESWMQIALRQKDDEIKRLTEERDRWQQMCANFKKEARIAEGGGTDGA
jgi:hypothetical protein